VDENQKRENGREASRRYRERNIEKERERSRSIRLRDIDAYNARKRSEYKLRKEKNPELEKEKSRKRNNRNKKSIIEWQIKNKDKCRKATRDHMRRYKKEYKDKALRRVYNISLEQYNDILESQSCVCAICGNHETRTDHRTGEVIRLAVDHDKISGKIRGLLCRRCNTGIGLLGHDTKRMISAIEYLEKSK
jgi:hypothetical protein